MSSGETRGPLSSNICVPAANVMKVPDQITHFVALDLGSESMAACYATHQMHEPEMIPLQEFAPLAYGESIRRLSGKKDYLLYESDNRTISDRLKSVIFLRENQPQPRLGEEHARIAFIEWHTDNGIPEPRLNPTEWQRSIFELFSSQNGRHEHFLAMPNPKVLFQYKADKVLPRPRSTREDRAEVALDAELLITHLTTLIVNNLILNSTALHDVPRENIHLTLTVPNVYSVEHVERLRSRVSELTGVQSLAAISESDALAHYYWSRQTEAPSGRKVRILTFDIGRGTTDVSLIQFETIGSSGKVLHEVVGRTGRTSGGGALTYILAEFYEARIRTAFKRHLSDLGFDSMPIGFTYASEDRPESSEQFRQALVAFDRYIDQIKRSFSADYRLIVPEEAKKLIPSIVLGLVVELEAVLAPQYRRKMNVVAASQAVRHPMHQQETVALAEAGGDPGTILNKALDSFLKEVKVILEESTQIPEGGAFKTHSLASVASRLTVSPVGPLAKLKRLFAKLLKGWKITEEPKPAKVDKLIHEDAELRDRLGRQIADYVDENTDTLLIELAMMTLPKDQRLLDMSAEESLDALMKDGITHAVIGGQASQFAPIRRRLGELFQAGECEFLPASELKKACCVGAVEWVRSGFVLKSPDSLFGTYAFVIRPPVQDWPVCIPLDTQRLNDPDVLAEEPLAPAAGSKILVASTRTLHGPDDRLTLNDPTVSILGTFPARNVNDEEPEKLRVTYEKQPGDTVRRLRVNGREAPSGSFGGTDRDIYPKVWPEQRRPTQN
jgi:hypothetical protein